MNINPYAGKQAFSELYTCRQAPAEKLFEYDRLYFPASRKFFLKEGIPLPGSEIYISCRSDKINGYGTTGKSGSGKVFIDMPEANKKAISCAQEMKMEKIFGTANVFQSAAGINLKNIYGITSFELG